LELSPDICVGDLTANDDIEVLKTQPNRPADKRISGPEEPPSLRQPNDQKGRIDNHVGKDG
jgi:hypothetical protein